MKKETAIITYGVTFLVGIALGLIVAIIPVPGQSSLVGRAEVNGYDTYPKPDEEILYLFGNIVTRDGKSLTVSLPSGKQVPVMIGDSTEIVVREQKTQDETSSTESPYNESAGSVDDLSDGKTIQMEFSENVIGKKTLNPTKVYVNKSM